MRIIPVIDLKDGLAVHAVKGERQAYQPVKSALLDTAEPLALANAFRQQLGSNDAYIADLDAILYARPQLELIAELAHGSGLNLMVDAGIHDPHSVLELLSIGASKVIIGAETLTTWDELQDIQDRVAGEKLVFSLDMRGGEILSRCPALNTLSPLEGASGYPKRYRQNIDRNDTPKIPGPELACGRRHSGYQRPAELEKLRRQRCFGSNNIAPWPAQPRSNLNFRLRLPTIAEKNKPPDRALLRRPP